MSSAANGWQKDWPPKKANESCQGKFPCKGKPCNCTGAYVGFHDLMPLATKSWWVSLRYLHCTTQLGTLQISEALRALVHIQLIYCVQCEIL